MDLPDHRLAAWAGGHHLVITALQLQALGFSPTMVATRRNRAQLHPQHRGVWSIGTDRLTLEGRCLAATLALGGDAAAGRRAAAALWSMRDRSIGDVDVVTARNLRNRPGIRVHTSTWLAPEDVVWRDGIRVTTPERTLADLAMVLGRAPLEAAIDRAVAGRILDPDRMAAVLARARRAPGSGVLREALGLTLTRSDLERRFLRFTRRLGLPAPETNVALGGFECDCWWPDRRLVVELDSWRFHRTRVVFERDHDRDLDLGAAGIRVVRITYRQLTRRTAAVAARLRFELA